MVLLALLYAEFTRHALKYAYPPSDQTKGDFLAFFEAGQAMRTGADLYVERHRNYIYPPLVALLYLPLTVLADPPTLHRTAGIIALFLNVTMSIATVWMLARESVRRLGSASALAAPWVVPVVALLATLIIADKTRSELRMWQTNVLMLFLIALGVRWLDRRPMLAGLILGLAVNIKYLPIAFLPWLLLRRRFRAAGGLVLGILAGAFAPALWVGWSTNLAYLRSGFAGLLGLFGVAPAPSSSHAVMEDIAGGLSISFTSAFARALGGPEHATGALAISALFCVGIAGAAALLYWKRGLPVLAWPSAAHQGQGPFPLLILLEAAAIIIALLAFGPQTNPRHLYLLLLPAAVAAALLIGGTFDDAMAHPAASGLRVRLPVLLGVLTLVGAISLPPGGTQTLDHALGVWRAIAGPSYGLLVLLVVLAWTITAAARRRCGSPPT